MVDMTNTNTTEIFTAYSNDNSELGDSLSLNGAVALIATAWRCPVEALHTAQCELMGALDMWNVFGPEDQFVGTIAVG